ncbi:hypothetical protein [Polyangium aurulentum]|uniref:hypothetical protein n=1 Tax=Polyangium aurulentum TaxID=2567896 RepID=UPI0010ADFB04|nr:hypothetical protein [Polyangium aurulentum]UQA55329.1 hypothetical protein E8A73_028765 [Polyangium aurulentum]
MRSLSVRGNEERIAAWARWGFVAVLGLVAAGCGRRPYVVHAVQALPPPPPPQGEQTTVIIVVPDGAEEPQVEVRSAAPVEVEEPAEEAWIPKALPAGNPFARTRTWIGDYDCVQGTTALALRIVDVRGRVVRAIFDFHHSPTSAAGSYLVSGTFDPSTHRVRFDPGRWIVRPDDYVMTSMEGEVASDGSLFAGRIAFPGCGAFQLKPAR